MPARVPNIFQRLTLGWDRLHPYNAAQVIVLDAAPGVDIVRSTWHLTLRELGLDSFGAGAHPDVANINGGIALDAYLSSEMNRPFDVTDPRYSPFRPFVQTAGGGVHLGVVYHHWAADSGSIRLLLRDWFVRLFHPELAHRRPLCFPARGFWHHFGPDRAGWDLGDALSDGWRWSSRLKKARRVETPALGDLTAGFSHHATPPGLLSALLPAARSAGATLNDVFLAIIAQTCDRYGPVVRTRRRGDLALGTIVDLRSRQRDLADAFGLFLGFTNILVRPRDLDHFPSLVRVIARQNLHNKLAHAAEASFVRMSLGLVASRLFDRDKLLNWYRKRLPLAGGISNVNLDRDWPARFHPAPLRNFIRVSPVGPTMPLVFTPTTLGGKIEFGLTVRSALVNPDDAAAMARFFTERLIQVAAHGISA